MSFFFKLIALGFVSALVAGCVRVPHLEGPANVPVNDIVKRIKCDLVRIVRAKTLEDPRFGFLSQWASKVHLTLVVDDTGNVSPGATFTEPLQAPGTSFSLGIGAGLTTEAVRTVDLEFFLSFPEMFEEFKRLSPQQAEERYNKCMFDDGILLESNLDLKSVIDKALDPVAHGVLYAGTHPGGGAPAIPANEFSSYRKTLAALRQIGDIGAINLDATIMRYPNASTFKKVADDLNTVKAAASPDAKAAVEAKIAEDMENIARNVERAGRLDVNARGLVTNVVGPLFDVAQSTFSKECLGKVAEQRYYAVSAAAVVSYKKAEVDTAASIDASNTAFKSLEESFAKASAYAKAFLDSATACSQVTIVTAKKKPAMYDPINVIGETVNFYVTLTGSITPTWRLVRVTAPNASTFLSGTRKTTNTLIIAMGRPTPSDDGGPPTSKAIDNQILYSILNQAIVPR